MSKSCTNCGHSLGNDKLDSDCNSEQCIYERLRTAYLESEAKLAEVTAERDDAVRDESIRATQRLAAAVELADAKTALTAIIAELRNYQLNGSDAVAQIRGIYSDLELATREAAEAEARVAELKAALKLVYDSHQELHDSSILTETIEEPAWAALAHPDDDTALKTLLAAGQARESVLRDLLASLAEYPEHRLVPPCTCFICGAQKLARTLLSMKKPDDTALREFGCKVANATMTWTFTDNVAPVGEREKTIVDAVLKGGK